MNRRVSIWKHVRLANGKWRYCRPVRDEKGKIVADMVVVPGGLNRAQQLNDRLLERTAISSAAGASPRLSEVERKMLYFTESGWTLPDIMKVNEDFDRDYDQNDYEHKIAKLVRKTDKRIRKGSREDYDRWWAAIRFLQREDHYISVMVRLAGLRPRGDQLRLFATALGIVVCILVWIFISIKYNIPMPSRGSLGIFVWVVLVCLFVAYTLLRFIIGSKRADNLTSKLLEKIVRVYRGAG